MKIFSQINNSGNGLLLLCFSKIKCKDCEGCYIGQRSRNLETRYKEHMRHVKSLDLEKSAIAAHTWSLGHRFEEKPILLKHISNRPLPELLIWEKIFIYKNKEVAINFETPQFSDFYKLMDADGGRQKALVTGQSNSSWGWRESATSFK